MSSESEEYDWWSGSGSGSGWWSGSGDWWYSWYEWKVDRLKGKVEDLEDDLDGAETAFGAVTGVLLAIIVALFIGLIVTCCLLRKAKKMANAAPMKSNAVAPPTSANLWNPQYGAMPYGVSQAPLPQKQAHSSVVHVLPPANNPEPRDPRAELMPNSPPPAYRSPPPQN